MTRRFLNEGKVIDAVNAIISQKAQECGDICVLPPIPEYPEQCWILLRCVNFLSFEEIRNLQAALHRRDIYSICICATDAGDYGQAAIKICAHIPEMPMRFFDNDLDYD